MKRTFEELLTMMERNGTHIKTLGRESKHSATGNWERGVESIHQTAKNTVTEAGAGEDSNEDTQHVDFEAGENDPDLDEEDLMLDDE